MEYLGVRVALENLVDHNRQGCYMSGKKEDWELLGPYIPNEIYLSECRYLLLSQFFLLSL